MTLNNQIGGFYKSNLSYYEQLPSLALVLGIPVYISKEMGFTIIELNF
jgi:hypothetical protein